MKNIALVAWFKAESGGNFIEQITALKESLDTARYNMIFVFPDIAATKHWHKRLIDKGIKIKSLSFNSSKINLVMELIAIIRDNNIDILHHHFGHITNEVIIACKLCGTKIVYHSHLRLREYKSMGSKIKAFIKYRVFYRHVKIIAIQENMGNDFYRLGMKDASIIHNSIDFKRLENNSQRQQIRERYNVDDNETILLMMGREVHMKGVDVALKALEIFDSKKEVNALKLFIAAASNKMVIEQYIMDTYNGKIPKWIEVLPSTDAIADYYKMADCFISPSRYEGFSYAILEAIYMKLPIIMSNIPSTMWAAKYKSVNAFECENYTQLNKVIQIFIQNKIPLKDLEESRNEVCNYYSTTRWCKDIINIYDSYL